MTRVTVLTPSGRGALAVVGVAGTTAQELVARLFTPRGGPLGGRPDGAIVFGRWDGGVDGPGEDLVVVRRGATSIEVHCHGGIAASEAVVEGLVRQGAVRQAWPEWLREGGTPDIEVEAREALARAGGPKAARILSRQLAGSLRAEMERVVRCQVAGRVDEAIAAIDRLIRAARVGLRLVRPWRVVLAGSVNAGKSSLVNALAGHPRSIVSAEPGTTRDLLETRVVLHGWEIDLVDTAGDREGDDTGARVSEIERAGIARAITAREEADLVIHVVEGPPAAANAFASREARDVDRDLLVASKADLGRPAIPEGPVGMVRTSTVTGEGMEELIDAIVRKLAPEEAEDPSLLAGAVPFTERQVRILESLRQTIGGATPPRPSARRTHE